MNMPFDDDDDQPMDANDRQSSLANYSRDDSTRAGLASVDGLDDENDGGRRRKKSQAGRRKKRRKVSIDDRTELKSKDMKNSIDDTSDIVLNNILKPSAWVPGQKAVSFEASDQELLMKHLPYDKLFTRPTVGDDGELAPVLLELWARNTRPVIGKKFPYKLQEDVEALRADGSVGTDEESRGSAQAANSDDDMPPPNMDDDDVPVPMDDDDMPPPMDDDFDSPAKNRRSSSLSLGLVNNLLIDDEDDPRQEVGDELVSSSSKWHKHTVKVYKILKESMSGPDEEETEGKAEVLSYNDLSEGSSRRTAAGVFFELLQLKTWDFVELDQSESYGDIKISAGAKFLEGPPKASIAST